MKINKDKTKLTKKSNQIKSNQIKSNQIRAEENSRENEMMKTHKPH
jgi:hypothetical protein